MKGIEWHIEKRKIGDLKPYDKNPRVLTKKGMADLKQSIEKFGLAEPIVCQPDGTIIGGHARYETIKNNGTGNIDVYVPERKLTEKEYKELNIRLNKNIAGEFDFDILANEFEFEDLLEYGFDEKELIGFNAEATEDDYEMPDKIETDIKLGDLFEIGDHRLLCGDSIKKENVQRLMNGNKVDMMLTDPPYKMGNKSNLAKCKKGNNPSKNISKSLIENTERIKEFIDFDPTEFVLNCINNDYKSVYIFTSKELIKKYLNLFEGYNYTILVWKKDKQSPFYIQDYVADIEYILYFFKAGKIWNTHNKFENYYRVRNVSSLNNQIHPLTKPIDLIMPFIENSSNRKNVILDLFIGSGTTMVASEQLNRKCYAIEISPEYCQITIDRMLKLNPELSVKKIQ